MRTPQDGESPGALSYIEVEDVTRTLENAEAAGGKVIVPRTEIRNMGHYAVLLVPGDVPQGIFETA